METLKQKPLHKIQNGRVQASIWNHNSEKGSFFSVTFKIGYQKDGAWKDGHSYPTHTLDQLIDAATDAKAWMRNHRPTKEHAA